MTSTPKSLTLREIAAAYGVSVAQARAVSSMFEPAPILPTAVGRRPLRYTTASVAAASRTLGWKRLRADGGRA